MAYKYKVADIITKYEILPAPPLLILTTKIQIHKQMSFA